MFSALVLQGSSVAVVVIVAVAWQGWPVGLALGYGGAVALANAGLLVYRWWRGVKDYHCDGERHLRSFHRSSLERFFVVMLLMAAGLGLLRLAPLPMVTGFILGQLAWVIAVAVRKTE